MTLTLTVSPTLTTSSTVSTRRGASSPAPRVLSRPAVPADELEHARARGSERAVAAAAGCGCRGSESAVAGADCGCRCDRAVFARREASATVFAPREEASATDWR
eukprot:scaffold56281_cov48-Phaeocystis_antarctica.AAC.2